MQNVASINEIESHRSWRDRVNLALTRRSLLDNRSIFRELNPDIEHSPVVRPDLTKYRDAAVLFPIIDHDSEPTVLFTVRSSEMPSHAGQISFPGGGVQSGDTNSASTALRETHEEIGVSAENIEVIGDMGVHLGGSGFAVTPVIGLVHPGVEFNPCPREVESVFEVPLEFLLDEANHIIEERKNNGVTYRMPAIPYGEYHIWGLTAGIVHSLARAAGEEAE